MQKKSMLVFWGSTIFLISVLLGFVAYNVSHPPQNFASPISTPKNNEVSALKNVIPNDVEVREEEIKASHFLARLNGNKIEIYVYTEGTPQTEGNEPNEKFLYNINVHLSELTEQDVEQLKSGIILYSKEDLASFEEDFSS